MEQFEDENPFEGEVERIPSEDSSASQVDVSEPSSPKPYHPARLLSPTSPNFTSQFPSPGSHKHTQSVSKSDFCCARDRVLHSGEDVEIVVRHADSRVFLI